MEFKWRGCWDALHALLQGMLGLHGMRLSLPAWQQGAVRLRSNAVQLGLPVLGGRLLIERHGLCTCRHHNDEQVSGGIPCRPHIRGTQLSGRSGIRSGAASYRRHERGRGLRAQQRSSGRHQPVLLVRHLCRCGPCTCNKLRMRIESSLQALITAPFPPHTRL